jgi:hypothetical protein
MKLSKRILAFTCVIALVFSLPMLAWAAESPSNEKEATGANDVVLDVVVEGGGVLTSVTATQAQASNVQASLTTNDKVLASFEVESTGNITNATLTFSVGTQWAGYTCKVFIEHNDGSTEMKTVTVAANGTVSIQVNKLSLFTIVVDETSAPSGGGGNSDVSPTSPKTGVDTSLATGVVAGATIVMAFAAIFVAVALRKRVTR